MSNKYKIFLISFFATMLMLPNFLMLFDINNRIDLNENKAISKFPKLTTNITVLAKEIRDYYLNNFGFKKTSFLMYSFFKTKLLNENPLPNRVVKGKEEWFFLGDYGKNVFSNNAGAKQIKLHEKIAIQNNIQSYFNKSKEFEIPFYMMVCPDKHQIYSDFLPYNLVNKESKFEQVLADLNEKESRLKLLKDELLERKVENKIYYKTDSHWNDLGALYGFNAMLKIIQVDFPELRSLSIQNFEAENKPMGRQDLVEMIGLDVPEKAIHLAPKVKKYNQKFEWLDGVRVRRLYNYDNKLKVVVFHDSYSLALMKYFGMTFKESVFVKSLPNYDLIKKEQPDIVVLQMVNRKIETLCTKQVF